MERLRKLIYKNREIIYADYRNLKELEMIELTERHRDLILIENKPSYFIANYENTFGTPAYMDAARDFTMATKRLVKKGAFLGITGPKVYLLKGITFFMDVNFKTFDSEEDALEFLTSH